MDRCTLREEDSHGFPGKSAFAFGVIELDAPDLHYTQDHLPSSLSC